MQLTSFACQEKALFKLGCGQQSKPQLGETAATKANGSAANSENNNSEMAAPKINFPAENSPQRASSSSFLRPKVPLKPGRSLMDWIRLGNSGKDLTGTGGEVRRVSVEELSKHNKESDVWIAVRGKSGIFCPILRQMVS